MLLHLLIKQYQKIRKQLKSGELREIVTRVYTTNLAGNPNKIVLRNWFFILSHLYPDALLSHRNAIEGKPVQGHIFLSYSSTRNVQLLGLMVHLLKDAGNEAGGCTFLKSFIAHPSQELSWKICNQHVVLPVFPKRLTAGLWRVNWKKSSV